MALNTQTANYVNISELPRGKEVRDFLWDCGHVSFGDASLTLVNQHRLRTALEDWEECPGALRPAEFLEALKALPYDTYVSLETP